MSIFIIDGVKKELKMIDSETGVDWSNEFIGNTSHGMQYDEDGNFIATQEDYEWWDKMIEDYQNMEGIIADYKQNYGDDEVETCFAKTHCFDYMLEDLASSVITTLKEWFG